MQGRISLRRLQWRHAQSVGSAGAHMTIWMSRNQLKETDKDPHAYAERNALMPPMNGGRGGGSAAIEGEAPRVMITGGLPERVEEPLPPPAGEPPMPPDDDGLT